jgi:hypothetical protein
MRSRGVCPGSDGSVKARSELEPAFPGDLVLLEPVPIVTASPGMSSRPPESDKGRNFSDHRDTSKHIESDIECSNEVTKAHRSRDPDRRGTVGPCYPSSGRGCRRASSDDGASHFERLAPGTRCTWGLPACRRTYRRPPRSASCVATTRSRSSRVGKAT